MVTLDKVESKVEGTPWCINTGSTRKGVDTTKKVILQIRPKTTFNSVTNRGRAFIEEISLMPTEKNCLVELWKNPTVGGSPSWTSVHTNSRVEYDTSGTTVSGGTIVKSFYLAGGAGDNTSKDVNYTFDLKIPLLVDADGNDSDNLAIVARGLNGESKIYAAMNWIEYDN